MIIRDLKKAAFSEVSHNSEVKKTELLKFCEIPNIAMFSQVKFEPGQSVTAHKHKDMYELFFVENGRGIIKINNEIFEVDAGVCLVAEPQEIHEIKNDSDSFLIITYFGVIDPELNTI